MDSAGRDYCRGQAECETSACLGFPSLEHDNKDRIVGVYQLEAATCRPQERNDVMTFLAIPVDPAVSHSIHAGLEPLRAICPDILWEHPADYHVTLRFLGRCTGAQIANLVLQLGGEELLRCPPSFSRWNSVKVCLSVSDHCCGERYARF